MVRILDTALCMGIGVVLALIDPLWGAVTAILSLLGDEFRVGFEWEVADAINATVLWVWMVRTASRVCHWTAWLVSLPTSMLWAVGVYARRHGLKAHAETCHRLWHVGGVVGLALLARGLVNPEYVNTPFD